jgi:hypothetical protein
LIVDFGFRISDWLQILDGSPIIGFVSSFQLAPSMQKSNRGRNRRNRQSKIANSWILATTLATVAE